MSQEIRTLGISPKAALAFLLPLITATMVAAANWITVGTFDTDSVKAQLAGVVLALVAAIGAYAGKPGNVQPANPWTDPWTDPPPADAPPPAIVPDAPAPGPL